MAVADIQRDPNCPFCKIINGDDPSTQIICEGNDWVAFFPLDPATPGHTLIVPRTHVSDFWSADPSLVAALALAALNVGQAVKRALKPGGLNLITSDGEAAEQTIFHTHLHVLPRWDADGFGHIWPRKGQADPQQLEQAARDIAKECLRFR